MAKISTIKECIQVCRGAGVTPFIWGHRGLGKSSLVRQVAEENRWGFIDLRCSQLEASDIRGLPERVDGRTVYFPPADMPVGDLTAEGVKYRIHPKPNPSSTGDCEYEQEMRLHLESVHKLQPRYPNGILFLDEVNRAQDDVIQAIFQLVLDRAVGSYVLPPGWSVVAAGNYNQGYLVNSFNDAAFIDRFCHMILSAGDATAEEWATYMYNSHGVDAESVVSFAADNIANLDGQVDGDLGFSVQPSRRSWEAVIRINRYCNSHNVESTVRLEVLSGMIGRELAIAFMNYSCPVKPYDVINDGVKAHEVKIATLTRNQLTGLMWGICGISKDKVDTDGNVAETCLDFAECIMRYSNDKDLVVAFIRNLIAANHNDSSNKTRLAMVSNPNVAKLLSQFKPANSKKEFWQRLNDRPHFQQILSDVAWGKE